MTGPGKTSLIYTNTLVHIIACISCSVAIYYPKSVRFIECFMDLCIYDDILDATQIADKKLLATF